MDGQSNHQFLSECLQTCLQPQRRKYQIDFRWMQIFKKNVFLKVWRLRRIVLSRIRLRLKHFCYWCWRSEFSFGIGIFYFGVIWKIPKISNPCAIFKKNIFKQNLMFMLRECWKTNQSQLKRYLFLIRRTYWCQKLRPKFLKFSTEIWNIFKKYETKIGLLRFSDHQDFSNSLKIPEIRDFFKSRDFYPWDFRKISGIYAKSPGFGIFNLRVFFRGMRYPDKKPPMLKTL